MSEFISQAFSSVVLVIPSKEVEELAAANNLTFTELLKPFNKFRASQFPSMFNLRFRALKDIVRATVKEAQEVTLGTVASFDAKLVDESSNILTPEPTPWFKAYEQEFLGLVRASDHEFFNHPQACLSVVSSTHTDPVNWLEQSFSLTNPPRPFSAQQMDPNILRHFLVVHDGTDPDTTQAEAVLAKMKAKFGKKNCQLLVINTFVGVKPSDDTMSSIWGPLRRTSSSSPPKATRARTDSTSTSARTSSSSPPPTAPLEQDDSIKRSDTDTDSVADAVDADGVPANDGTASDDAASDPLQQANVEPDTNKHLLGKKLSPEDLERLQVFVRVFGESCFIPYLENVEEKLEVHIAQTKKSAYGAAKKWFGLGSSSTKVVQESNDTSGVSHLPMRMALRRLGDVVFTLQKYELAINTYHTLKKEFSHDKGFKERAGASEMEGISVYLQDNSRADNRYFDNAIGWYDRCNAQLYHCRAVLIAANIAVERHKYRDAAIQMMKSANNNSSSDLNAGLLLEQVAICNLKMKNGNQRRAAFFMMLSGHRFVKAGLKKNGLRVYTQGRKVYAGNGWCLAADHLNFSVGRQSQHIGDHEGALDSFTRLLRPNNDQQIAQQKLYLSEFISSWKAVHANDAEDAEIAELPFPLIDNDSITLSMNDIDTKTSDPAWNALEKPILIHARHKRSRVSSVSTFTRRTKVEQNPVCVAGEPLYLKVTLRNPLRIPIELRAVKLMAFVTDADKNLTPLESMSVVPVVKIAAKGTAMIELCATSNVAGQIQIEGIQCSLQGHVLGCRKFSGRGRRKNDLHAQKIGVVYGQDFRLTPIVIPPMPLLEGQIDGLPAAFVSGCIFNSSLILQNNSKATLFRLFVGCSRTKEHLLFHDEAYKGKGKLIHEGNITILVLDLPDGLAAGSALSLPFSCQPTANDSGMFDLMFMVYYEAKVPHMRQPYRMLKLDACAPVIPSLNVATTMYRAPKSLDQRLFRVVATNVHAQTASIALQSLVCNSKWWDVKCLSRATPEDIKSQFTLQQGESITFLCQANQRTSEDVNGDTDTDTDNTNVANSIGGAEDNEEHNRHVITLAKQSSKEECSNVMTEQFLQRGASSDLMFALVWELFLHNTTTTNENKHKHKSSSDKSSDTSTISAGVGGSDVKDAIDKAVDSGVKIIGHSMVAIDLTNSESTRAIGGAVAGVEVGIKHDNVFEHDFTQSPFAVVEVEAIIQNCSGTQVTVIVELLDHLATKGKHGTFSWIGKTKLLSGPLQPLEIVSLPVSLAISCPGVYDVNRISVVARSELGSSAANMIHQSLITVVQSTKSC
eukprot:m.230695 g.230695  ORF g.230695 m.230695 type:complete len:1307 (-) comp33586_c0_seq1:116-4036(-)